MLINFTLGDPSKKGHEHAFEYFMESNKSAAIITDAYTQFVTKTGFDFARDIGDSYEECKLVESQAKILVENGIDLSEVERWDDPEVEEYFISEDSYLDIFYQIIKTQLPDFEWHNIKPECETLDILHGAGYGLFGY